MGSMQMDRLTSSDLDECVSLAKSRDWSPERLKWGLLFEVGEVYGLRVGGRLVSTVVLTNYGDRYGVISMVLTAPDQARKGLARALTQHVLEQAGDRVLSLTATPNGRPLYEQLGFETVGEVSSHAGEFTGEPSGRSRPATPRDLERVLALDAKLFEADRSVLLTKLPGMRVIEDDGEIAAYGTAWDTGDSWVGGPIVAHSPGHAQALIADLAQGKRVRLDLDTRQEEMSRWAAAHGVTPFFATKLMVRGGPLPGDRGRLVTSANVALG